jgi:hypothetical protein
MSGPELGMDGTTVGVWVAEMVTASGGDGKIAMRRLKVWVMVTSDVVSSLRGGRLMVARRW